VSAMDGGAVGKVVGDSEACLCTVAHKTIPMFGGFEQMDLVQSDDIIYGFGTYVQETTSS